MRPCFVGLAEPGLANALGDFGAVESRQPSRGPIGASKIKLDQDAAQVQKNRFRHHGAQGLRYLPVALYREDSTLDPSIVF